MKKVYCTTDADDITFRAVARILTNYIDGYGYDVYKYDTDRWGNRYFRWVYHLAKLEPESNWVETTQHNLID